MKNQKTIKIELKEIEANVKKIDGSMAQEGMLLTNEIKNNIRACLMGISSTEKECQKVIERYKQIYG